MRKVVAGLFISLDGVTESPEKWQFDFFDADMGAAMATHLSNEDTILLGRVTYQDWLPYWPNSTEEPYASHINQIPKYVVSKTLNKVEWGKFDNITLIRDNLAAEIARMKQLPGKNIGVAGSPSLVHSMLQAGMLDELTLMIHPIIVGKGKRLFKGDSSLQKMRLTGSNMTGSGVAFLTYQPA